MKSFEYFKSNLDGKNAGAFIVSISGHEDLLDQSEISFRVFLNHISGQKALEPVAIIMYSTEDAPDRGRFEVCYTPFVVFEGTAIEKQRISIAGTEHERELFQLFFSVASAGDMFKIKYKIERRFLPAKSQHINVRDVLSALLNNGGFTDVEFIEYVGNEPSEKGDLTLSEAVVGTTIETTIFAAKKQ